MTTRRTNRTVVLTRRALYVLFATLAIVTQSFSPTFSPSIFPFSFSTQAFANSADAEIADFGFGGIVICTPDGLKIVPIRADSGTPEEPSHDIDAHCAYGFCNQCNTPLANAATTQLTHFPTKDSASQGAPDQTTPQRIERALFHPRAPPII